MIMPFGAHALITIYRLLEAELATCISTEIPSLEIFVDHAETKVLYVNCESKCWRDCVTYAIDLLL